MSLIDQNLLNNSYSYEDYRTLISELVNKGQTTGSDQSNGLIEATKMNLHRIERADKGLELDDMLISAVSRLRMPLKWIVLLEAWCGDGAQNIPVINKIAESSPNISLHIILRDEHPEIMDHYLTNGARAIPKLICLNGETMEEIGTWGPRPETLLEELKRFKSSFPNWTKNELVTFVHRWYAKDKNHSIQKDFAKLIKEWSGVVATSDCD